MSGRRFGPLVHAGGVAFRLFAPGANQVTLLIGEPTLISALPMKRRPNGWFECNVAGAGNGTLYKFRIDDEIDVPDPASSFQPHGIDSWSQVIDHRYNWRANGWRGRRWHESIMLELHVGTFSAGGSFSAAIERLDALVETGFTAIELMPVAEFSGRWNWGYDGVLLFAPAHVYGRPDDLKALIDAAHQRGLMVLLDVVYNHFGPEGNYLGRYAPQFFTKAETPWGSAIDYQNPDVKAFAIENALHWLQNYQFDGLRLDAVHAIPDPGKTVLLRGLSEATGELAAQTGRHIHIVLENDDNRSDLLDPLTDPPRGKYRAQWNDDYHHAWHVLLSGERHGYYKDYAEAGRRLAQTLAHGFAYRGEPSLHRHGSRRGQPTELLPPTAFVNFLQNHDQIGNRVRGERLDALAQPQALEAALAVTLLSPAPPLLFMGEQWASDKPFPFFCDFQGDLGEAVRQGRKREFAEDYAVHPQDIPDPLTEATKASAVLDWNMSAEQVKRLDLVRRLLLARQRAVIPILPMLLPNAATASYDDDVLHASWRLADGRAFLLSANLGPRDRPPVPKAADTVQIWGETGATTLAPWTVDVALVRR